MSACAEIRSVEFNVRCPNASTPSQIGIAVAAIIHYQKLIFTLMRILKGVQFGLKRSRWILARNIPLFSGKVEVALENFSKLGKLDLYVQVVISPSKE